MGGVLSLNGYALLAISIVFATLNNCLVHAAGDKQLDTHSVWFFNAVSCAGSLGILWCVNGGFAAVQQSTVMFGIAYGSATAVFLIGKMMAFSSGPITVTTLIGNCSLVIPTLFGLLYYRETASVWQLVGLAGILASLFLCVKTPGKTGTYSRRWLLWCLLLFLAAGAVSVVFKLYRASPGKDEINEMMMVAYGVAGGLLLIASVGNRQGAAVVRRVLKRDMAWLLVLCTVSSTVYNRLNIYLSGAMDSVVFFPIFNGGVILLATLCGIWFYGEKLQARQILGLGIGTASIILIGVF